MRRHQVLFQVELPLALPLIMTGLRLALIQVVATATIAAYVSFGGLGRYVFDGLAQRDLVQVLGGAVLVAVVAVVLDLALSALPARPLPQSPRQVGLGARATMNRRTLLGGLFAAASVPALASCSGGITSLDGQGSGGGGGGSSKDGVTIGTANFTENQVLGYLYAAALEAAGVKTTVRPNLGTREILIPALEGGDIDLLPEYQGALLHYLDPKAKATEEGEMQNALAIALPRGLQILPYGQAEDSDAFAVTRETAEEVRPHVPRRPGRSTTASSSSAPPPR